MFNFANFDSFSACSVCKPRDNVASSTVSVDMRSIQNMAASRDEAKSERDREFAEDVVETERQSEAEKDAEERRLQSEREAEEERRLAEADAEERRLQREREADEERRLAEELQKQKEREIAEKARLDKEAAEEAERQRVALEQQEMQRLKREKAVREQLVKSFLETKGFKQGINGAKRSLLSVTYPLHKAAEGGDSKLVDALLKQGANASQKNSSSRTALQVAQKEDAHGSHARVIMLLKSASVSESQAAPKSLRVGGA